MENLAKNLKFSHKLKVSSKTKFSKMENVQ